jgi:hypothetical protein
MNSLGEVDDDNDDEDDENAETADLADVDDDDERNLDEVSIQFHIHFLLNYFITNFKYNISN